MKKILSISVSLWLIFLLACTRAPQSFNTVTFLVPPDEVDIWSELGRDFERDNPDVKVQVIEGPNSTDARETFFTTSLLAGDSTSDLLYIDVIWTPKFAAAGWLDDLTDLLSAEELKDFLPGGIAASTYRNRLYRVPMRSDTGLLYYRKDLLEQAGRRVPETFAELIETARQLQQPPRLWGYIWQGKQYEGLVCDYLEVLVGMGGYWIDTRTNEVGLDQPEAIAALRFLRDSVRMHAISPPGVSTYQEEEGRRLFQQGGAVFHRNWPYAWKLFQGDDSAVKGKIGVRTMVHGESGQSAATQGGWGFAISRFSRNKAAAARFLRYTASFAAQKKLILAKSYVPARHSLFKDEDILTAFPFYRDLYSIELAAVPRPPVPQYAAVSDILQRYASAAISDRLSIEDALTRAARETRALIK